jgi:hypothetical protein
MRYRKCPHSACVKPAECNNYQRCRVREMDGKRYAPEVYAALARKRAERERVTGNSEKERKL